jgi:hypothetical protein
MNVEPAPYNEFDTAFVVHMTDPKPTFNGVPVLHEQEDTTTLGFYRIVIRRVLRQHIADLRACYARGIATKPSLAGRLSLRFTIDPNGNTKDVISVTPSPLDVDVTPCVTNALASMNFPQPQGGSITMVYPLVFAP